VQTLKNHIGKKMYLLVCDCLLIYDTSRFYDRW